MPERLIDAMGIPFDDARKWLPARANEVTPPKIVDKKLRREWREQWIGTPCWYCRRPTIEGDLRRRGESNHIVRHDAAWALSWICADCHRILGDAVTSDALPKLLRRKLEYDRLNTSWVHIGLGLRTHLPVEI